MSSRVKISPHLEIFRSEVPALFSISKRIFGMLFVVLFLAKSVFVIFLSDSFFGEFNLLWNAFYNGYGTYGFTPLYVINGEYFADTVILSEVCLFFGFVGAINYILDVLLILSISFYTVTFFVYKEDVRLSEYGSTVVAMPFIVLIILLLAYLNVKVWL